MKRIRTKWMIWITGIIAALLLFSGRGLISYADEADFVFRGSGTRQDPYRITSLEDLSLFRDLVNAGCDFEGMYFAQTEDIDAGSVVWRTIGNFAIDSFFAGVYDGKGHEIRNLHMDQRVTGEDYAGLFFFLRGVVANLKLTNVSIYAENVGTVAVMSDEEANPAVINCFVTGSVTADQAGGICLNFANAAILNCGSDLDFHPIKEAKMSAKSIQKWKDAKTGGITLIPSKVRVFHCMSVRNQIMPMAVYTSISNVVGYAVEVTAPYYQLKWGLDSALTKALFGKIYEVDILPNNFDKSEFPIGYAESSKIFDFIDFLNEMFIPLLAGLIILIVLIRLIRLGRKTIYEKCKKGLDALAIIFSILAFFCDCAAAYVPMNCFNGWSIALLVLLNLGAVLFGVIVLSNNSFLQNKKDNLYFLLGTVIILAFTIPQFSITPLYDGSIYYGSLATAAELYRLDLFTFIGAFVCWKWIHGSALFIAPFEFFFRGNMTGLYISNVIMMVVSFVLLYRVLQMLYKEIRPFTCFAAALALIFCPYQMGLFTYLSWDNYVVYYIIWMVYAYLKKNHHLVLLCGFIMSFTKITGMAFYTAFIVLTAFLENFNGLLTGKMRFRDVKIRPLRMLYYVLPVLAFMFTMLFGSHFQIQQFFGSPERSLIALKEPVSYLNTIVQGFVFAFRWLFTLGIIFSLFGMLIRRTSFRDYMEEDGMIALVSVYLSCIGCICLLLLYNGDAECPRYTAFMNIGNVLWLPLVLSVLWKRSGIRQTAAGVAALLMMVQTVWTIDPALILHESGIYSGKKMVYKLALDEDDRPEMNLGKDFSEHGMMGDLNAYNLEYTFYDSLIKEMLSDIDEPGESPFYLLDVADYEMHLMGNQYPMVWNPRLGKMSYDTKDPDAIKLTSGQVSDRSVLTKEAVTYFDITKDFYLIVPGRVPYEKEIQTILSCGYQTDGEKYYENIYGCMRVYHLYR